MRLDNGVTVLAKSNHTTPAVSVLVGVRTGAYYDPADRNGTAALAARVLDRASYDDPVRAAEGVMGVWVNGVATLDRGGVTGARGGRLLRRAGAAR